MNNTKPYTTFLKHTLLLFVVLFALSPCAVKASGTLIFNIEYQRPLNKTRTITSKVSSCEDTIFTQTEGVEIQKKQEVDLISIANDYPFLCIRNTEGAFAIKQYNESSKITCPLYILYNQLKIDIA